MLTLTPAEIDALTSPVGRIYLAITLRAFMAHTHRNGRRWGYQTVADAIARRFSDDASPSDATIKRFVDLDHKQQASPDTLRLVALFLMAEGAITARDLEALHLPRGIQLAAAIQSWFDPRGTARDARFRANLQGVYRQTISHAGYAILAQLVVLTDQHSAALRLAEGLVLYRLHGTPFAGGVGALTVKDSLSLFPGPLLDAGHTPTAALWSSGFAALTASMGFGALSASPQAFDSLITWGGIAFDDDDQITGLTGQRNTGWQARAAGAWPVAPRITARSKNAAVIKALTGELAYHSLDHVLAQAKERGTVGRATDEPDARHFLDQPSTVGLDDAAQTIGSRDPASIASHAYAMGDLPLFTAALSHGADPNATPDGETEPYLILLAAACQLEWLTVLANTPGFDPLQRSHDGRLASMIGLHDIDLWQHVAATSTANVAQRMIDTAVFLRAGELNATPISPSGRS